MFQFYIINSDMQEVNIGCADSLQSAKEKYNVLKKDYTCTIFVKEIVYHNTDSWN